MQLNRHSKRKKKISVAILAVCARVLLTTHKTSAERKKNNKNKIMCYTNSVYRLRGPMPFCQCIHIEQAPSASNATERERTSETGGNIVKMYYVIHNYVLHEHAEAVFL